MADLAEPICFQCGQVFVADGRFNHLPDGRPCSLCADRLMDSLPPLLPCEDDTSGDEESGVLDEVADARDRERNDAPTRLRAVQNPPEPA